MSFSTTTTAGSPSRPALRLTSRRGSLSAPDPFAHNIKPDSHRGQTSRLTILRISSDAPSPALREDDADAYPKTLSRSHSFGKNPPTRFEDGDGPRKRMSFAHSSFSSTKPTAGEQQSSDLSSSRNRSASSPESLFTAKHRAASNPSLSTYGASFQSRRASLSPQRVCELAQSSLKMASAERTSDYISRSSGDSSPLSFLSRGSLATESVPQDAPENIHGPSSPFLALPESHYLPFFDRPSEVTALLSSGPNSRLTELLRQTFPLHLRDGSTGSDEPYPEDWSFRHLLSYITTCPRSEAPDNVWVVNIKRCIHARSEVIWERFKAVLGVPPDLDDDVSTIIGESGTTTPATDGENEEEVLVEPIYPESSPLSPMSPLVATVSPIDMGNNGFGYGGREHGMANIGEEDSIPSTASRGNALKDVIPSENATQSYEKIRALCLKTRMSISESSPPALEHSTDLSSSDSEVKERSLSEGHADKRSPLMHEEFERLFSLSRTRRSSVEQPEFERCPGDPLFPSNFGRLSIAPTLPANQPALGYAGSPIPSTYLRRYSSIGAEDLVRRRISNGSDYAVTVASGIDSERSVALAEHERLLR